ncbi:hypothetical protein BCR39DRAFT_466825 [Naematelia encephala]|uniref:Vacuole protein n=1 Tax=Naematelia encephala TaxID=71784 RepID=A0A1Y2B5V2_9TREE|nr:hypothetical protein BCR39DRAFT_466825 [Naematelia encephala]
MCCEAEWKREVVQDHKFDFINVSEFHRTDILTRLKYVWKYILILKAFAVMGLDIFTAVTMISSNHWTNTIQSRCGDDCAVDVKFAIAKWVFVGCIIFSFLLYGYELWKAKWVIDSRDISYAFTNLLANDYCSLKSYDNFCLFCYIDRSTKKKDDFAFFVFFTFKDWKRLLLADGPRQSINALILYSFANSFGWQTSDIPAYWDNSPITAMLLFSMILTVLIFAGSLILLIIAAVCYVPLLCYIQGNLKASSEYVCHKVDKRIAELLRKKQRQRVARNLALEKQLAKSGMKTMNGEMVLPTLPDVKLDDDALSISGASKPRSKKMEYDNYNMNVAGLGYPPVVEYQTPYGGAGMLYMEDHGR